jgi:mono/diheme cytochrome c family protein
MIKFIAGIVFALLLIPVLVYLYFHNGYAQVATNSKPWPFEMTLAHMALDAHIDKEAPKSTPFQASEAELIDGAHLYREHCSVCHGLPGQDKTALAKGMYPAPPQLMHGKGVTDDPAGETYWKVASGIRLTGMPAYDKSLSEKQMWEVSELLAGADKLTPAVTDVLKKPITWD